MADARAEAIARIQARADEAKRDREGMRERYPGHAFLTDWARAGGLEVAAVTVDDRTFGKRTADAKPMSLLTYASEIQEALRDGRIRIAGQVKPRRLFGGVAQGQKSFGDV